MIDAIGRDRITSAIVAIGTFRERLRPTILMRQGFLASTSSEWRSDMWLEPGRRHQRHHAFVDRPFALATRTESDLPAALARHAAGVRRSRGDHVALESSRTSLWSALACLAASASYGAGYVYMARYLIGKGLSPLVLSASQLIAASGLLILATPFGGLDTPHWRLDAVIGLLALGAWVPGSPTS